MLAREELEALAVGEAGEADWAIGGKPALTCGRAVLTLFECGELSIAEPGRLLRLRELLRILTYHAAVVLRAQQAMKWDVVRFELP